MYIITQSHSFNKNLRYTLHKKTSSSTSACLILFKSILVNIRQKNKTQMKSNLDQYFSST